MRNNETSEDFDRLFNVLRKYKGGSFKGPDTSLTVSLMDFYFVARPTDDVSDAWTVVLRVPETMRTGPGFKLETFHLDDMEDWFFDVFDSYDAYGINDPQFFWDHAGTMQLLQLYVHNCDLIFQPSHYFDDTMTAGELADLLSEK